MILWYHHCELTLGVLCQLLDGLVSPRDIAHARCNPGWPCVRVRVEDRSRTPVVLKRLRLAGLLLDCVVES